jgi:hypothetical protein
MRARKYAETKVIRALPRTPRRDTKLISFATPDLSQAVVLLSKSARRFGIPCEIFSPKSASIRELAALHPKIMQATRGAGYWLWKPWILLETLSKSPDGTIVLYTDAAVTIVGDPGPLLALAECHPIVLFEQHHEALQRATTKRDCFVVLDADNPLHWDTPQLVGGVQLYRACDAAREFVAEVFRAACDERVLTDQENVMGKPNLPEFRYHRHDQSVLTIVARRHRLPVFPDPTQFGPEDGQRNWPDRRDGILRPAVSYCRPLYVHRMRNTYWLVWIIRRLIGRYSAGRAV